MFLNMYKHNKINTQILLKSFKLHPAAAVMSDHLPMTFDLRIQKPPPLKVDKTSRKLKSINANSFTEDIRQSALVKNPAPGLDDLVDQYHSVLSNILDAHPPLITRHV